MRRQQLDLGLLATFGLGEVIGQHTDRWTSEGLGARRRRRSANPSRPLTTGLALLDSNGKQKFEGKHPLLEVKDILSPRAKSARWGAVLGCAGGWGRLCSMRALRASKHYRLSARLRPSRRDLVRWLSWRA
jgi:hypothetical protein